MARLDDLLLLEKAGQLPANMQKDLDTLRSAGQVPGGEPANSTPPSDAPGEMGGAPGEIDATIGGQQTGSTQPRSAMGGMVDAITGNPIAQAVGGMAKKSVLPVAGSLAGATIGTTLGGPAGTVIGESVGSGLGEAANQLTGVTEFSLPEIALAMVAGPATRGVMLGVRKGVGAAASAFGGRQAITDIATDVAKKVFGPATPSDELFETAGKLVGNVPTGHAGKAVQDALDKEVGSVSQVSQTIRDALEPYAQYFQGGMNAPRGHDIQRVIQDAQDLRWASKVALKADNSRVYQAVKGVRSALIKDATDSGFPELAAAAKAYRREMSVETLGDIIRKPNALKEFDDKISRKAKDQLFAQEWNPTEQKQIKDILSKLARVAPSGFAGVAGRSIAGAVGAQVAPGDSTAGKVIGGVAGFMAPEIVASALATSVGRKFVVNMLTEHPFQASKFATAVTQFVRSQNAEDAKDGEIGDTIKAFLKGNNLSIDDKIKASMVGAQQGGAAGMPVQ